MSISHEGVFHCIAVQSTYILSCTVSKLSQIIVQIWCEEQSLCILSPFFGGLVTTYTVHHRLIRKLLLDFLLVIIELFH